MLLHEFQPGKLVAGACLVGAAVAYAGDADGLWETPWFVAVPVVVGGLCLAGAVGAVDRTVRRRRTRAARGPDLGEGRPDGGRPG
ncbi:hypothetical protein [Streptomyces sp. NPDC056160]|uniref:hypothetical protein n=1 Tax=Streptomyces sp. NPDC056160 TaxID=3345731 RepID=UPI0035E22D24